MSELKPSEVFLSGDRGDFCKLLNQYKTQNEKIHMFYCDFLSWLYEHNKIISNPHSLLKEYKSHVKKES